MKDEHVGILLEDIRDQLQKFAEAMADVPGDVRDIKDRLDRVEADIKVVKTLVREHESRLETIEKAA